MNKQQILEATLDLACEKGLGSISLSMIAERVNLKKSSLYSHFKSKEEIIESMYEYFREKAKSHSGVAAVDYGALTEGRTLYEILTLVVNSYRTMNSDSDMDQFYRLIESERTFNPSAAAIMVEETEKMIQATKSLFYAISAKSVTHFRDPDSAALSFAMGVHSILNYECDAKMAGSHAADGMMDRYIEEFCKVYAER